MNIQKLSELRYQMTKCGGMAEWTPLESPPLHTFAQILNGYKN